MSLPGAEMVEALLLQLNAEGWRIGTDQFIATNNVLLVLNVEPELLLPGQTAADWIAPIICRSRGDQQIFRARFAVLERAADKEKEAMFTAPRRPMKSAGRTWRVLTFVALLMLTGAGLMMYYYPSQQPETTGQIPKTPDVKPWEQASWMLDPYSLTALGVAGFMLLAIVALLKRRSHHDLSKIFAHDKDLDHHFPKIGTSVFIPSDVRRVTQRLRLRRNVEAQNLNVDRSVERTVRSAGFFTPVYAMRGVTPEYLALIDRASVDDQQSILYHNVLERVRGDDVLVDVYEFHGDPRLCWREGRKDDRCTLDDLISRHPDRVVLLFTDGSELLNTWTREPFDWTEALATSFRSTAMFTSRPVDEWDDTEWRLARAGMLVLPSTTAGLAAMVEALERPTREEVPEPVLRSAHAIALDDDIWLLNSAPLPAAMQQLLAELELRLGEEGMTWLAACAVYPALHWYLTLYLGSKLQIADMEQQLVALVRLPWFRRGVMPDWLRTELILTLPRPTERQIRKHLEELFRAAVRGERGESELHLVTFRALMHASPDDSPLREYVLVRFMSGRSPKGLVLRVNEMFQSVVEAIQRPPKRRDSALRVVLACFPFLGFFATMSKSASQELRWHAWNGFAIALAWYALATTIGPTRFSIIGIYTFLGALFGVYVLAARRALHGARLRIPTFSRIADHLVAAEQGAPLNRAWRALLLLGCYTNPVTALLLFGIRIPDLRWHARNGVVVTAVMWVLVFEQPLGIVPGYFLLVVLAFALCGVIQGMRLRPLRLGWLSRIAGQFPADVVRDRAFVLPAPVYIGVALIIFECLAFAVFLRQQVMDLTSMKGYELAAFLVVALLGGWIPYRKNTVIAGVVITSAGLLSEFSQADRLMILLVGAALTVPGAVLFTAGVARERGRSAGPALTFIFASVVLALPFISSEVQLIDTGNLILHQVGIGAFGGILALILARKQDEGTTANEPQVQATFASCALLVASAFILLPATSMCTTVAKGFFGDELWIWGLLIAPVVLIAFLGCGLETDTRKRLQAAWATMTLGLFLGTLAFAIRTTVGSFETFGKDNEAVFLIGGGLIGSVILIPAGLIEATALPRRWRSFGVGIWTAMLIGSLAYGEELVSFTSRAPIPITALMIAFACLYRYRELVATKVSTWIALIRHWLREHAPSGRRAIRLGLAPR